MSVAKPDKDSDEKRFNETLKRMLKTPPKPHEERNKGSNSDLPRNRVSVKPTKSKEKQ